MKTNTVSCTWDTLPDLTGDQMARLDALAEAPERKIDLSDAPELGDEQWKNGIRGKFFHASEHQITTSVDAEVLAWLNSHGEGSQSLINAILRREMLADSRR
jgi:uncharacterized protein (DUF4415 family)